MEKRLTTDKVLYLVTESDSDDGVDWNMSDGSDYGEELDYQAVWEPDPLDCAEEETTLKEQFQHLNMVKKYFLISQYSNKCAFCRMWKLWTTSMIKVHH